MSCPPRWSCILYFVPRASRGRKWRVCRADMNGVDVWIVVRCFWSAMTAKTQGKLNWITKRGSEGFTSWGPRGKMKEGALFARKFEPFLRRSRWPKCQSPFSRTVSLLYAVGWRTLIKSLIKWNCEKKKHHKKTRATQGNVLCSFISRNTRIYSFNFWL